jgi:hypothetical protein
MSIYKKLIEARRAGFEAAMDAADKNPGQWLNGSYRNAYGQAAWIGYNAALDSVVVELPGYMGLGQACTGTPMSEIRAHNHFNDAITQCKKAIRAAGVRTK